MKRRKIDQKIYCLSSWHLILILLFVGLPLLMACAGPDSGYGANEEEGSDGSNSNLKITEVNYAVVNMAPNHPILDMFAEAPADVNSCFWFTIDFIDPDYQESAEDGEEFEEEDESLEENFTDLTITFSFKGKYEWTVYGSDPNVRVDRELGQKGKILVMNLHPWDSTGEYAYPENVLPLGYLTVNIEWGADKKAQYRQNIAGPGEADTAVSNLAYTEDVLRVPGGTGVHAMLQRAEDLGSRLMPDGTATILFAVPDNRVFNGEIWFFDDNGDPVGSSGEFESLEEGRNPALNNGTGLKDGYSENVVRINLSQVSPIEFASEELDSSSITKYAILLTDQVVFDPYLNTLTSGYISITSISEFGTQTTAVW